jgi:hypothetical protein
MKFEVIGCPVVEGMQPCGRMCGGGWPGTSVSTRALTDAILAGNLDASKLGCGMLICRAQEGIRRLQEIRANESLGEA